MAFEDFKIDETTGDLVIDEGGNMAGVEGAQRVRQQLEARLDLQRRSWYRDERVGVDYHGKVLGKPFREDEARAEFVRESLATPGVTSVSTVAFVLSSAGALAVRVDAVTDEGIAITAEV